MNVPGIGPLTAGQFADPVWLAFIAAPIAVAVVYALVQRHSRRRLQRFTGRRTVRRRLRHLPLVAAMAALVALTVALAQPERDEQIPHDLAVVMLVVDVSESMTATDVEPSRLEAAEKAAADFATHVAPGVNLGLVAFDGNADVVVSPTPRHEATTDALKVLKPGDQTATGSALFAAMSSIDTLNSVLSQSGSEQPPARIVLLSDGKENTPMNLDAPQGAYTAARLAAQRHIPVSTITVGTSGGHVTVDGQDVAVPVDDDSMRRIAALTGGTSYDATDPAQLSADYDGVRSEIGYQTIHVPDGSSWLRLGVLLAVVGAAGGLVVNRRLPA